MQSVFGVKTAPKDQFEACRPWMIQEAGREQKVAVVNVLWNYLL
jgi:hypothetical protein